MGFIASPSRVRKEASVAPRCGDEIIMMPPPSFYALQNTHRPSSGSALSSLPPTVGKSAIGKTARTFGARQTAVISLAAMVIGLVIGRLTGRRGKSLNRLSNADEVSSQYSFNQDDEGTVVLDDDEEYQWDGVTPVWLNAALTRMWLLFQKNTRRVVQNVIQPVLDESEMPDFVTGVRVVSFVSGNQSPYLRALKRMPTRALAEVQYSLQTRFSSTSVLEFEVDVTLPKLVNVSVPVTLKNPDVDLVCWSAFKLAPYEPFCTSVEYALLETPKISFDMTVFGLIPITAIPVLRSYFFRILTEDIPREFLFPNTVTIDFTPQVIRDHQGLKVSMLLTDPQGELSEEELVEQFPEQWALFDSLDLDSSGSLGPRELAAGLKDWGYTAEDAAESFKTLDVNRDKSISFPEFCRMWPSLESSFVPSRYKGLLTVFVRRAQELATPAVGKADLSVELRISTCSEQSATTKRTSQTFQDGEPGFPVWREVFELKCLSPDDDELEIVILDNSRLTWYKGGVKRKCIGKATVPLESLAKKPIQQLKLDLEPKGSLLLDLSYANFVDRPDKLVTSS